MELVLNLIWLAVVFLVSVGTWIRCVSKPEPVQDWKTFAIVLACVAMLLFPAISLSDDLHMECVAAEASGKYQYQLLLNVNNAMTPNFIALLLLALFAALARKSELGISEQNNLHPIDGFLPKLRGRAPPAFAN